MTGDSIFPPVTRVTVAYSAPGRVSTAYFDVLRNTASVSSLCARSSLAMRAISEPESVNTAASCRSMVCPAPCGR